MWIKAQIPTLSVKVSQDCGITSHLTNTTTAIEKRLHKTFGFSYSCTNVPEILLNVALNTNNSNHCPTLSIYFIQIVSVDFMILLDVRMKSINNNNICIPVFIHIHMYEPSMDIRSYSHSFNSLNTLITAPGCHGYHQI